MMNQITDTAMRAAYEKLKRLSADPEVRRLAAERDRVLFEEQMDLAEARKEGMEEGLKKGMEKGKEMAREKGKEAFRREMATNLLRLAEIDDATIAAVTGLDQKEVTALRQMPQ